MQWKENSEKLFKIHNAKHCELQPREFYDSTLHMKAKEIWWMENKFYWNIFDFLVCISMGELLRATLMNDEFKWAFSGFKKSVKSRWGVAQSVVDATCVLCLVNLLEILSLCKFELGSTTQLTAAVFNHTFTLFPRISLDPRVALLFAERQLSTAWTWELILILNDLDT